MIKKLLPETGVGNGGKCKDICLGTFTFLFLSLLVAVILNGVLDAAFFQHLERVILAAFLIVICFIILAVEVEASRDMDSIDNEKPAGAYFCLAILLTVLSGVAVLSKGLDLGKVAYPLSITTASTVFLLSMLLLEWE